MHYRSTWPLWVCPASESEWKDQPLPVSTTMFEFETTPSPTSTSTSVPSRSILPHPVPGRLEAGLLQLTTSTHVNRKVF